MEYEGEIISVEGNKVTFELNANFDIEQALRLSLDGNPKAIVRIVDERNMTHAQNGMIHALFRDISLHTGHSPEFVKDFLKAMFSAVKGKESFSMENHGISQVFAGEFIEHILEFCFQNEIPFKYQQFHMHSDITRTLFLYIKYRQCFVCGKSHADIHHAAGLVGMGNKRNKHNHLKSRFMSLCREHHNLIHSMGLQAFMKEYHLIPIKVDNETLVDLGIITKEEVKRHQESLKSEE